MYHDEENEQALLGACLRDYKLVLPKIAAYIGPLDFYKTFHQETYEAILSLFNTGKSVNPTTVMTVLRKEGKEYSLDYFTFLIERCISSHGYEEYAGRVKECSLRRNIYNAFQRILSDINKDTPVDQILSMASLQINELIDATKSQSKRSRYSLDETLHEFYNELGKVAPGGLSTKRQLKTGFGNFDRTFGGLRKGSLIYLGGRPSMGKSTLSLQWALNIARAGGTVYYCSFEIGKTELLSKLVCLRSDMCGSVIDNGPIDDLAMTRIAETCSLLYDTHFVFSDTSMNCQEIMLEAQQIRETLGGLDAIFIDRIELIRDRMAASENRNLQLGRISQALNRMAIELDIPVVCLVQLSRQAARRGSAESHRPILSDFRDSGSIEQDAKMAVMVHREEMYTKKPEYKGKAEVICAKNMFGQTGLIENRFRKEIPAFYEEYMSDYSISE